MTSGELKALALIFLAANPTVDTYYQSPTDGACFLTQKAAIEHERAMNGDATQAAINTLIANAKNPSVGTVSRAALKPVANFTGTPLTGEAPLAVQFTDSSTEAPISWAWNFGDGNTSTSQSPSHSYAAPGTYTVVLIATNLAGSNTKTRTGYVVAS